MASEVFITRRGKTSNTTVSLGLLPSIIFTTSGTFKVPSDAVDNKFYIKLIGGGGTANDYSGGSWGGGSGYFNNGVYTLTPGQSISVSIGSSTETTPSGYFNGGTVSFGTYISGNGGCGNGLGGSGGTRYSGRIMGGDGEQFGGGFGSYYGGNAGPYGGGGGAEEDSDRSYGGNGGIYGGGGGGSMSTKTGDGGTYGGGGGGPTPGKCGSANGGNGGNTTVAANNGINTSTWTNVTIDEVTGDYFRGKGLGGGILGGGGGYGGNGGNGITHTYSSRNYYAGGGGGGYGSNGGNAGASSSSAKRYPGSGGGYGGDGGSNGNGGGGYGKGAIGWAPGGAGYYCPSGGVNKTTGGGGIGIWYNKVLIASYGSGGSYYGNVGTLGGRAETGAVIIQYVPK